MKLTRKQRSALADLADGDDLVFEQGAGWWIGERRTNGQLGLSLVSLALVSKDSSSGIDRYEINETGRRALDGLLPYRDADGVYHDSLADLLGI